MRPLRFRSAILPLSFLLLSILLPRTARAGSGIWTPIGPYGGTLRTVVFHPTQPGTVWAGTETNGVFLSLNGGEGWLPVNQGLPSGFRTVTFLDLSTAGRQTLYAFLPGYGLYRSIEGRRWERTSPATGLPIGVHALAADPFREGVLWGSSQPLDEVPGIARSDDGGATWDQVFPLAGDPGGSIPTGFVFAPGEPSTLWAGLSASSDGTAPRGVVRSRDGGVSWEDASSGLDLPEQGVVSVSLEIARETGVLFATAVWPVGGDSTFRVYRSADGGDHWTLVLPAGGPVTAGAGGLVLAQGGFRSLDGGLTWSPLVVPAPAYVLEAHPASPGQILLGLYLRGVLRSTDAGASWRESNQGLLAAQALDLAVDPLHPGTLYASLMGAGLFKTTDGGLAWEHLLPPAGDFAFFLIEQLAAVASGGETTVYGVDLGLWILRSEDGGASWTGGNVPGVPVAALAVDSKAPLSIYAGTGLAVQCPARRSTDGGETWKCMGLGRTTDLAVDPSRPANVWAVSRIVYRSTDRGRTWKAASRGLPPDQIRTLTVAPSDGNVVYAGAWEGVYKTTDGGRSWIAVPTGLPPHAVVTSIAVHPRNPSIVYAAVESGSGLDTPGVYRSIGGGKHWKKLASGLPAGFGGPVVIDPHDPRTLYAGTRSRGFYAITLRR